MMKWSTSALLLTAACTAQHAARESSAAGAVAAVPASLPSASPARPVPPSTPVASAVAAIAAIAAVAPSLPSASTDTTTAAASPAPDGAFQSAEPLPSGPGTLTFRRIHAGMMPVRATRETWVLARDDARTVVQVRFEQTARELEVDGSERSAHVWQEIGGARWTGPAGHHGATELVRVASVGTRPWRDPVPEQLTMRCAAKRLLALTGTAVFVAGDACGNGGPRPRWRPAGTTAVRVEACRFDEMPDDAWAGEMAFAEGAGVEWVFVNDDCAGQEGAYRRRVEDLP